MIVHCESIGGVDMLYGMGDNRWGQLARDPNKQVFLDTLQPMEIATIDKEYVNFKFIEAECGSYHTLVMVEVTRLNNHFKVIVQMGNEFAELGGDFVTQFSRRGKRKKHKSYKVVN